MKKSLLAIIFAGIAASAAVASPLTPQQALARAMASPQAKAAGAAPTLAMTVSVDGSAACYVFNKANGYIVAPADDMAPAVLGYADSGAIDPASMPPALRYWLDQYSQQIAYARSIGAPVCLASASAPQREPIEPMTATRWNQDAPFNDLCPMDNGQRSVTGCVATALAQVMAYHKYPERGTSGHSYTWNGHTLSVNFANTTYNWANMLDVYTSSATPEQRQAVATLMYSCGVAVEMDYSSSESGAAAISVPAAMVNYFGYDKGIRYYSRDYYGLSEWQDIVYEQLKDYGPVQYSGQSNEGGHSFVCDGYSQDGYFHFNWGWGGMSDGYFLLTALDPESQGIGGTTAGYNFDQSVIGCVSKPKSDSKIYEQMAFEDGFAIKQSSAQQGASVTVEGPVYNLSIGEISGCLGLKFVDGQGNVTYGVGTQFSKVPSLQGFSQYQATVPTTLNNGIYKVTPVFRDASGEWHDCLVPMSAVRSATATVNGNNVSFKADTAATLTFSNMQTSLTPYYVGCDFEVKATATNSSDSEYYGSVVVALISPYGYVEAYGDQYPVDLMPGESVDIDYISAFSNVPNAGYSAGSASGVQPGQYQACFMDSELSNVMSGAWTVNLQAEPSNTQIEVGNVQLADGGSVVADKAHFKATAQVECTTGYFAGPLTLAIFPYSDGDVSAVAAFYSEPLFLEAGKTASVAFSGDFSAAVDGQQYMAFVYNGQSQESQEPLIFTVGGGSGIADAAADTAPAQYYSLSGQRLGAHPSRALLHIKVTGGRGQLEY